MEGLLIDHLVEHTDGDGTWYSRRCTLCGESWNSPRLPGMTRALAAREAAKHTRMCPFCGRPVCSSCFTDADGIPRCTVCDRGLRERAAAYRISQL